MENTKNSETLQLCKKNLNQIGYSFATFFGFFLLPRVLGEGWALLIWGPLIFLILVVLAVLLIIFTVRGCVRAFRFSRESHKKEEEVPRVVNKLKIISLVFLCLIIYFFWTILLNYVATPR